MDKEEYIRLNGSRVDGTAEWITFNEEYVSWVSQNRSGLLWLNGGPGMGKSVLAIFITGLLEKRVERTNNSTLAYYFCNNRDEKRNTAITVLRGLLLQLIRQRPALCEYIQQVLKQQKTLFDSNVLVTLWDIFEKIVADPEFGNLYFVLDGLDECEESSRGYLLTKLEAYVRQNANKPHQNTLKILILSRRDADIEECLQNFPTIDLQSREIQRVRREDIRKFIADKVESLATNKQYPASLRQLIEEALEANSGGTFLWVALTCAQLERKKGRLGVEKALKNLPPGINDIYARILRQIYNCSEDYLSIARSILCWVVTAVRPLTLQELSVALESDIENETGEIKDYVALCGSFLQTNKLDDTVVLVHQSAKDYLLDLRQERTDPEVEYFKHESKEANMKIATTCFNYIQEVIPKTDVIDFSSYNHTNHKSEPPWFDLGSDHQLQMRKHLNLQSTLIQYPLIAYAITQWPYHLRLSPLSYQSDFDLERNFFQTSNLRNAWCHSYFSHSNYGNPPKDFSPLHIASMCGILPWATRLLGSLTMPVDIIPRDSTGRTPLHWAAMEGNVAIAELLLNGGVDKEAKDDRGDTALLVAAARGNEGVIRVLLNVGVDKEAKDGRGDTALLVAARWGKEGVAKVLLDGGVNMEAKNNRGDTALLVAANGGNEGVVQELLDRGVDKEARGGDGGTALLVAAMKGSERVIKALLDGGVDKEARNRFGETALLMAVGKGDFEVVKQLLDEGVDKEAKIHGDTALLVVAGLDCNDEQLGGDITEVVKLLLSRGVDKETKNILGETALLVAVLERNEQVTKELLDGGVDTEARNNDGETALLVVAREWDGAAARLLLDYRADKEAKNNHGETALLVAARTGNRDVARVLLDDGANKEAMDKDGQTALDVALRGYDWMSKMLLEAGVRKGTNQGLLPPPAKRQRLDDGDRYG